MEGPWLTGVTAWVCSRRPPLAVGMQAQYWPHLPSVPPKAPNPAFCVKSSFEMWVTIQKVFFKNQWANRTYLQVTQDPQTATVQPLCQELAGLRVVGVGDEPSFLPSAPLPSPPDPEVDADWACPTCEYKKFYRYIHQLSFCREKFAYGKQFTH